MKPEPAKYHIELHLVSGNIVALRLCDPHDPSKPSNSVEAQKSAMGMADYMADPIGKVLAGVTITGEYAMVRDYSIDHMRVAGSPTPWAPCQLDIEVFAPDEHDEEAAEVIHLEDMRPATRRWAETDED